MLLRYRTYQHLGHHRFTQGKQGANHISNDIGKIDAKYLCTQVSHYWSHTWFGHANQPYFVFTDSTDNNFIIDHIKEAVYPVEISNQPVKFTY